MNYKQFGLLENQKAKKLQSDLKNLKFLIIDEMSLIGLRTLYQIESRCREIFANEIDKPFGGLIIYLFGDYNQLTLGYLREIIYSNNDSTPQLPEAIMVEFDNYPGSYLYKKLFR